MLSMHVKMSVVRIHTISNLQSCCVLVFGPAVNLLVGVQLEAESMVLHARVYNVFYVCVFLCVVRPFLPPNWCVFMRVFARLCLYADVRSGEEVAVFV